MKVRSAYDLWVGARQATKALADAGYGHEDIAVKLVELRLPSQGQWVKWWVMHGRWSEK